MLNKSINDYTSGKVNNIDVDTIKNKFPFCENGAISLPFITSDDDPRTLTDIENEAKRILDKGDTEKTADEIEAEQLQAEITAKEQRLTCIKDKLLTAVLLDDTDTVNSLKAEYKELLNERV